MADHPRLTLPIGSLLLALLAILFQSGYVGGSASAPDRSPAALDANVQATASPCATTPAIVDPGMPIESNNLTITLEDGDFRVGPNTLTVRITTADGAAVTGALVFLEIRMPAMDHGVSAYPASEQTDGRYQADNVSLGMAGEWDVSVQVIRQARAPSGATYRVMVET